ncbi:MAG: molybdopterin-dependent oxidoreductase [Collinsella sp.]
MPIAPLRPMLRMGVWWRLPGRGTVRGACPVRAGRHRLSMPFDERDRILHPMRRRADGSGFDAISWDEAFAQIAARLGEIVDGHGPRALGMTLGVPSFDRYWGYRLMHALGSPNVYGADGACEVSRLTGWEHSGLQPRLRPGAYRLHHVSGAFHRRFVDDGGR